MPNTPSVLVVAGIPLLTLLVAAASLGLWHRARGSASAQEPGAARPLWVVGGWLALWGGVAATGLLSRFDVRPPPMLLMFLALQAVAFYLGLSRVGARLADATPIVALVGLQAFRLPLELVMHQAAVEGVMPAQMSYGGWNFDIVTGLTAGLLALWLASGRAVPRAVLWGWNVLGTVLLANVLVIAMASTPLFAAFGSEPSRLNVWVTRFPYVYLPAALVVVAITGHIVIFRRLLRTAPGAAPMSELARATGV